MINEGANIAPSCLMSLLVNLNFAVGRNRYLPFEHFLEGDESLAAPQSHFHEAVVDNLQQVVVVLGIEFDEQVILAGCEIALDNLGDGLESSDNFIELRGVVEEKADVGASLEAYRGRINQGNGAPDDAHVVKFLNALMDGSTRNIARPGDFEIRLTRIEREHLQNLVIK